MKAGNLKTYALTGSQRLAGRPDVPTVAEVGFPELTMSLWYGFSAPNGTPMPIVERLSQALPEAIKDPAVRAQLAKLDTQPFDVAQATPEGLYEKLSSEVTHWGQVIQQAGVVPQQRHAYCRRGACSDASPFFRWWGPLTALADCQTI